MATRLRMSNSCTRRRTRMYDTNRSSRRCVLECGESRLRTLRRDDVALALVALDRLLERLSGVLRAAGEEHHLGEIRVHGALRVEHVGLLGRRDRFAREPLGLAVLATSCEHLGSHLPPEHLRDRVVTRAELCRMA